MAGELVIHTYMVLDKKDEKYDVAMLMLHYMLAPHITDKNYLIDHLIIKNSRNVSPNILLLLPR